jgi:hypothetical protein
MSNLLKSKFLLGAMIVAVMAVGVVVANATPAAAADCSITSTLRVGSKGDQVKCLQATVGVTADGSFGKLTKAAVQAWQTSKGLVADGIFGAKSRAAFTGSSTSTTYSAGCSAGTLYSSTTGQPCSSTTTTVAGCENGALYNSNTGASCSGAVVVPTTGSVTVSLASDNPAAGTLLIDDTTGVMQNAAPIAKFVFANGTGSEVKVNTVKLTRTGIAADGDINNLFLYEGATKIAELSSVSTKVFSFNSSAGLFTIPANSSKAIWVGINMAVATSGPTSIAFKINSAADVVLSSGVTAAGSFPIQGNEFATAFITDLGYINLTSTTTYPATLDPKPEAQEVWRFTATASSQKMEIKKVVMTLVGTTSPGDIQDLAISVGGVQVGATAQLGTDNKVTFDWSAAPYQLLSGQNKVFVLSGKVVKGTGRAFKFTIRSTADFVSTDTNYLADTVPLLDGAALTVVDPNAAGDGTNINNGSLTISRSANSPSGNVASGALDVPLVRFDYRANGEDIKVSYVRIKVNNSQNTTLDDGKLYFNGSQVGLTDDSVADAVTADTVTDANTYVFSLGNTVIIPAGTTGVFEYRANIQNAAGTDLTADGTIIVYLVAGVSGDALGQISLTSLTPSASTGQTLTIKSGALSVAKNTSVADATTVNSTGVVGATNVLVGSMVITAGAGEPVNVTQIVVGDDPADGTSDFGDNFQNLTLRHGSSTSTPLATVQGTLSGEDGADYTFSLSPSVTIAAGGQYVVDLYADILTGAGNYATAEIGLEFVNASATGVNTSADAYPTATIANLQTLVISAGGTLVITANASTPVAGQLVMGETGQTLAILDFAAGSAEDANVSVITITDTGDFGGSLSNIKLYSNNTADGASGLLGTIASFTPASDPQTNGTATFNLSSDWVIAKNQTKTLTIKGDVNAYGSAVSGGSHTINLASANNLTTRGAQSGATIAETVTTAPTPTGTAQSVYRSKPTVTLASTSPSGSQTVGSGKSVLEFNVAANSAYDVVVNAVAVTMSGSLNTTSSGNAVLYKSTDLSTALATETYKAYTADGGGSTTTIVLSTGFAGVPIGANVRIYDNDSPEYLGTVEVTTIDATTVTFTPALSEVTDAGDILYYRPLQPGTGKLYFGAQATTTGTAGAGTIANGATAVTVPSTDGFAVGDVVTIAGYNSTNVLCTTSTSIGTLTSITATVLTASGGFVVDCSSGADTITTAQLSGTPANAILNSQNGIAVVYTGLINTSGQIVSAGTTTTFVVKGDTTSTGTAGTTANLEADIAAVADFVWDDKTSFGVTTVTKNLPVTGGTLTYTY